MGDFLTAVTSRAEKDGDGALTAVRTIKSKQAPEAAKDKIIPSPKLDRIDVTTPQQALHVLRSQPDITALLATLRKLSSTTFPDFHLAAPGPLQAQIVNSIVSDIVPAFWSTFDRNERLLLVRCLRNTTGINGLLARLRTSSGSSGIEKGKARPQHAYTVEVVSQVLDGHLLVRDVLLDLHNAVPDRTRHDVALKELVTLLGSGKVISLIAQAEDAAQPSVGGSAGHNSWLARGSSYATWLGSNIASLFHQTHDNSGETYEQLMRHGGQLLAKSLTLGYPSALAEGLVSEAVPQGEKTLGDILPHMPSYAKKQLLEHILRWLSELCPTGYMHLQAKDDVPELAALIATLVRSEHASPTQHLRQICSDSMLVLSLSHPVRRACIAVVAQVDSEKLQSLLESLMGTFSNRVFIDHSPTLQQDSIAQMLLLTAGYLHRASPITALMVARSTGHMQGTSNRLNASNQRARWLGMVVATAISGLVDREGSRMSFGIDEVKTDEALWYLSLVTVKDHEGELSAFEAILARQEKAIKVTRRAYHNEAKALPMLNGKPVYGPPRPPTPVQTEVIGEKVTELLDEISDDDDDDLKPYGKPDSDPEDSDEDATLVNRNKPRPPVYIRDLMSMIRDDKTPDRFQLGMKHAASLIRRKANFGKEVKDHAEEIMGLLCNLQDPFDTEQFEELKLQAMIAVLLSDVETMGPWLSTHAFVEGYSIAQRCIILSTIGLGGRELAGFTGEDELNPVLRNAERPNKRLAARQLHTASANMKMLETATKKIEDDLMQPLALQAADHTTAHLNAVKVRTFSSRMAVERTKRKPAPNQLAKIFASSFFFPLVNRYLQDIAAYGSRSVFSSAPVVLVTFLRTLALLVHASGPATPNLQELSVEFWDLLLSLRVQAAGDITVLEAVLFATLTLLDVTSTQQQRMLIQDEAKRVAEMQQWVGVVFERAGGGEMISGDSQEESKIRTLAAGVMVKIGDMIAEQEKAMYGG
ncbi:telomere binding protein [Elasticomyces elasticus]|nr:telomere binding protein [Elasticomyces elasticus]KAK3657046.1 telomere binding protein [Elasticomyces elasticus]KAK4926725.1 telomere binding protein [Elasticomyces elasticus]KAK5762324.1 telomere binding protein [Elasticomyces elasticus]